MSKTKRSSSAGGGGGQQQLQDASITKPSRRENGSIAPFAVPHLFNGVTSEPATAANHIGQHERTTTITIGGGAMSGTSRPSVTCNSSTVEDRKQHSSASAEAESDGATACSYVYRQPRARDETTIPLNYDDSAAAKFIDSRTTPIIQLLFYRTFIKANLDKDVIRRFDIEPVVKKLSPQERSFVQDTCEKYLEYLGGSEKVSIDSHRQALEVAGWEVSDNNVDAEFKKVVNQTFDENVTWGNVIGFLGFALGFSIFIHNKGMKRAVVSVAEWTKQVIEDDIGRFFLEHDGWDGFHEVVETLLKKQRRKQREQERARTQPDNTDSPTFWQSTAAVGAVAVGAAVLIGLKQAFS